MSILLEKIEEFNLGRGKSFRGDIRNSTLYIIHELDASQLSSSIAKLRELTQFREIQTIHISALDEFLPSVEDKDSAVILTIHLALDQEINTHRRISNQVFNSDIFQMNPYNKIAKIFDDKYLFYALMTANAIKQPYTELISKGQKFNSQKLNCYSKLIIKPRHGTEKIGFKRIDSLNSEETLEHINKIHDYDDCIVQEAIEFNSEFKVLYLQGKFYAKREIDKSLKAEIYEFVDLIDDYAKRNQIIMPEIFSLDILETMDRGYLILEANIRPAAIYKTA